MPNWYSIRAATDTAPAEISIFDEIGFWGVTAVDFGRDLKAVQGDTIDLLINSPGGNVVEALAICNLMQHSGKTINGKVMGIAASAATLIAAACTSLEMPENTFQYLHDPLDGLYGDADEHRAMADMLDKVAGPLIAMYVKRTGKPEADIKALLKNDSLLTAQECLDLGLCTKVTPAITASARYATDKLPAPVQAMFKAQGPALSSPQASLTAQIQALAEKQGMAEFAPVWLVDPALTTVEAATRAIADAAEIKAVCVATKQEALLPTLVRARKSVAEARAEIGAALEAADAATRIDTGSKSKPAKAANDPAAFNPTALWGQITDMKTRSTK